MVAPAPMLHAAEDVQAAERRRQILDAAERCFVHAGFHRSTMQEVAAEAGMSPGNIYRYFASKDAIVAGLTERNRAQMREQFAHLAESPDFMAAFAAMGRKYFRDDPREKTFLCLEIWAEATRNPAFAAMQAAFDRDISASMIAAFRQAQARGVIAPDVDIRSAELVISLLADGLMVRRAVGADFDPTRDVDAVVRLIGALLGGKLSYDTSANAKLDKASP